MDKCLDLNHPEADSSSKTLELDLMVKSQAFNIAFEPNNVIEAEKQIKVLRNEEQEQRFHFIQQALNYVNE